METHVGLKTSQTRVVISSLSADSWLCDLRGVYWSL